MKDARPLHERLRGLDADERCVVEVLSSVGIGDVDCPRACDECIAKAFEAMADEIERDYISKSDHEKAIDAMVEAQSGVNEPGYRSAHYVMQAYAESKGMPFEDGGCITDWINRWFVPRPLYDDGSPVQFGDEVELHYRGGGCDKGLMQSFHPNSGPVWILSFVGCNHERLCRYDSENDVLKRPVRKMLDADGVEIKVGDTVWHIESPERKMTVDSFQDAISIGKFVRCTFNGYIDNFNPRSLTHREPDSLEKLRDDLMAAHESWNGDPNKLVVYADRLAAIMERSTP